MNNNPYQSLLSGEGKVATHTPAGIGTAVLRFVARIMACASIGIFGGMAYFLVTWFVGEISVLDRWPHIRAFCMLGGGVGFIVGITWAASSLFLRCFGNVFLSVEAHLLFSRWHLPGQQA